MDTILITLPITVFFVIIGWWATHVLSSKRDYKNELRKIASSLICELEALEAISIQYHTSSSREVQLEIQITTKLDRLDLKLDKLTKCLNQENTFWLLKSVITMNNFREPNFHQQDCDSKIIDSITTQSGNIISKIYIID